MQPSLPTASPDRVPAPSTAPPGFIGVDVAKAELVTARLAPGLDAVGAASVANTPHAINAWLSGLPPGCFMAMESTGRYHGLLARMAHQAGHTVFVLNARDVHYYAQALGSRGKTDRLDALVIARYVAEHHRRLHPWSPPDGLQTQIDALLARRALLAKERATLGLSLRDAGLESVKAEVDKLLAGFGLLMDCIDRQVQVLIASSEPMAQGCALLRTITGIGPQASALLASLFSRMQFANGDAVVAYCGLDPRPRDSGTLHGRRRLSKRGPALLRRQIWLAGFAAVRSKAMGPVYKALRARGLPSTAAIAILGRKLLRIALAIWKSGKPFDPTKICPMEVKSA